MGSLKWQMIQTDPMGPFELAVKFFLDIIISIGLFTALASAALLVGLVVERIDHVGTLKPWMVTTLGWLESFVFVVDIIGFCFLVTMSLVEFLRDVWRAFWHRQTIR